MDVFPETDDPAPTVPGDGTRLLCPYGNGCQVWTWEDGAQCVDPDPNAGGAPGCGASWDAVGSVRTLPDRGRA